MAGIAVSAAEPSGLWGLLKESFAEGNALMTAKLDPGADALIKAVVADFETAEGRSTARDGLKEKLTGSKPSEITAKCIEPLRQAGAAARRCSGLQGLAAPDQPTRCRGCRGDAADVRCAAQRGPCRGPKTRSSVKPATPR